MLLHELLDARLVRFADGAEVGRQFRIVLAGDLAVAPQPLPVIVGEELRAERFRHRAFGLAVIAQQFFQAILRLRVSGSESRARGGSGIDVGNTELVAQNLDLLRRAESERYQ